MDTGQGGMKDGFDGYWIGWNEGRVEQILNRVDRRTGWMDTGQGGMKEGLDGYWIGWNEGRVGWTLVRME